LGTDANTLPGRGSRSRKTFSFFVTPRQSGLCADAHAQGTLIVFGDGTIKSFNQVLVEQGMRGCRGSRLPISNAQTKLADMRLKASEQSVIRKHLQTLGPEAESYLFGSRADDSARGGDIDLLVLTPTKVPLARIRKLRRAILEEIGEQKIDIVNLARSSRHPFKAVALETAIRL